MKQMDSLIDKIIELRLRGYVENFKISGGRLTTDNGMQSFQPDQIRINEFYRFEGDSNPDDMSILYAIETNSGIKGFIIDAYGVYSDPEESDFMQKIKELHKGNIY